ncbi:YihY/virulence factor BrkB family protein [Corynebacterium sp.]|uniref:YihY/virulence factor BrkB family protein n=1 Tax=Corynebacterium sp. TaxID=1720 RepID=UPI002A90E901|nr:YihY/virulence factor BrkB family protein [Corynebacterium sp.]MDY5785525.1 YihY/virulence factor BrkB family protein [Corynebacterium sp.]
MSKKESPVSYRAEMVLPYGEQPLDVVTPPGVLPDPLTAPGNRLSLAGWTLVAKRAVTDFSVDALVDRAATLTYYVLLTLAPAILATYSLVLLILPNTGNDVPELLREFIDRYVPDELHTQAFYLLDVIVGSPSQNTVALIASVAVSLLSASAYIRSFSRNANVIYGRSEGRNLVVIWATMGLATVVLEVGALSIILASLMRESIIIGFLAPVAEPLGLTEQLEYLTTVFLPVWSWLQIPFIAVVALGLISMLFHVAPNVNRGRYRPITVGSAFAFAVILAIWIGFSIFLSTVGVRSAYGAFGTVLTVLVLVWLMNMVLLLGVKVDAEVLRAKELQLGYDSERMIQAPPKSMEAVRFRIRIRHWVARTAERVKNARS